MSVICIDCDSRFKIESAKIGQIITCPECGADLEIINLEPLELDWAYYDDYDEDWDD